MKLTWIFAILALPVICGAQEAQALKISLSKPYSTKIDHNLTLGQLFKKGGYEPKNRVTDDPKDKRRGIRDLDFYLVSPNKDLSVFDYEILTLIDEEGMRPADKRELLTFGVAYPTEQTKYEIIALGSKSDESVCGEVWVPEIYSSLTLPISTMRTLGQLQSRKSPIQLPPTHAEPGPVKRYFGSTQSSGESGCTAYSFFKFPKGRTRLLVVKARQN